MLFTPTEQRIVDTLSDGKPHRKEELKLLLYSNGAGSSNTLAKHIYNIKPRLPHGQTIICEVRGHRYYYRLIRLLVVDE